MPSSSAVANGKFLRWAAEFHRVAGGTSPTKKSVDLQSIVKRYLGVEFYNCSATLIFMYAAQAADGAKIRSAGCADGHRLPGQRQRHRKRTEDQESDGSCDQPRERCTFKHTREGQQRRDTDQFLENLNELDVCFIMTIIMVNEAPSQVHRCLCSRNLRTHRKHRA